MPAAASCGVKCQANQPKKKTRNIKGSFNKTHNATYSRFSVCVCVLLMSYFVDLG
jgi:hypothetical protein